MIHRWIFKIIISVVLAGGSPAALLAQTSDFFSNTQSTGQLASGSSGCPTGATCTANGPGFNPTDLVKRADPAAAFTGVTPTGAAPSVFFSRLGPGAITDNMFGIISTPLSTNTTLCGNLPGDPNTGAGILPNAVGPNGSSLNCGDLRFDPTSQGQTIPTAPATNNIQFDLNPGKVGEFNGDFSPSTSDHTGFDLINDFTFILSPASSSGDQQMKQVTALTAGGTAATVGSPGTLTAPGTGDQNLQINTSWSLAGTFDSATNRPTITWTMSLKDVDPLTPNIAPFPTNQTDSINTMGTLSITSSSAIPGSPNTFVYNSGAFPQMAVPNSCWWTGCTTPAESMTIP